MLKWQGYKNLKILQKYIFKLFLMGFVNVWNRLEEMGLMDNHWFGK
jgi:hypothetical protein